LLPIHIRNFPFLLLLLAIDADTNGFLSCVLLDVFPLLLGCFGVIFLVLILVLLAS